MSSAEFLSHLEARAETAKSEHALARQNFQSYYAHCCSVEEHQGVSVGDRAKLHRLDLDARYAESLHLSFQETVRLYRAANAPGNPNSDAMFRLARRFRSGCWILGKDENEAKFWHHRAAELGNWDAMFALGLRYENHEEEEDDRGQGESMDLSQEQKAMEWYERAAREGHVPSALQLAHSYDTGVGVTREVNPGKAMGWYLKAAEQSNVKAILKVAQNYECGYGAEAPDTKNAIKWYERAARGMQDAKAMFMLASLLDKQDTLDSRANANRWMCDAAHHGHVGAMVSLAEKCVNGFRVNRDLLCGASWYMKAAEAQDTNDADPLTREKARQNYSMATECYIRADTGDAEEEPTHLKNLRKLAGMFDQGTPAVEPDWQKAIVLFSIIIDIIQIRVKKIKDKMSSGYISSKREAQKEISLYQQDVIECCLRAINLKRAILQRRCTEATKLPFS